MKFIALQIILLLLVHSPLRAQEEVSVPLRKWETEFQRLQERTRLSQLGGKLDIFLTQRQKPTSNTLKSAILPGLGQLKAKSTIKGVTFLTTFLASVGGGTYLLILSNQEYDKYKSADNIEDINKHYDDSNKFLKYSQISFGAGALIWTVNIFDAFMTTKTRNRRLFKKFYYSYEKNMIVPIMGAQKGEMTIGLIYKF